MVEYRAVFRILSELGGGGGGGGGRMAMGGQNSDLHTKTSCKILHESYIILASWILHSLALQNLARLMQDHQDSCIMEKILQFQLVQKS